MAAMSMFLAALAAQAAAPARTDPCLGVARPVIDVHVHAYANDPRWAARTPSPATGRPLDVIGEAAHRASTLAELRRLGVIRAIVDEEAAADGQAGRRMVAAAPERMRLAMEVWQPDAPTLARIRRLHAEHGLVAISEVGTQYNGYSPDDPRMEPLWALAEELDLPVGLHMGLGWPGVNRDMPAMRMRLGNPLLLEDVLVRHPNLRIFIMHAGWPHLDSLIAMLHSFPNLYIDIGVINWAVPEAEFHHYLRRIVNAGFADRVMFGSDQMVWTDAIGLAIERIDRADYLTEAQRRDIMFSNAVRFFRWSELAACGR